MLRGPWRNRALVVAALVLCGCQPRGARELTIVQSVAAVTLDPHHHDNLMTHSALSHLFEALVGFDADMQVVPALAVSWENPGETSWRFRLRPGVRFHDGRALTAADAAASLQRARAETSQLRYHLAGVAHVRAIDETTLEVITQGPQPDLLNHLVFVAIVPKDAPAEITRPVGTGPWAYASGAAGEELRAARFDGYWGARPAFDAVRIRGLAAPARRARAIADGAADVVTQFPPEHWQQAQRQSGQRTLARRSLSVLMLGLRATEGSPFRDPRVREAAALAIDRRTLVERGQAGLGAALDQLVPPEVAGYARGLPPLLADPARARGLLAEAGFAQGLDVSLRVSDMLEPAGREVARQLALVGLRARVEVLPTKDFFARWHEPGPQLVLFAYSAPTGDAKSLLDPLVRAPRGGFGEFNAFAYDSPRLEALLERAGNTVARGDRLALLSEAAALLRADRPVVPLAQRLELYAVRDGLQWTPRLDRMVRAQDAAPSG
ncbi:MAG: ABC transporter substrate-binding protein [Vicinamibacteria bacterium]|nr:ABC transporter substrate-binding protein [Vicinamibacteria bacterium]